MPDLIAENQSLIDTAPRIDRSAATGPGPAGGNVLRHLVPRAWAPARRSLSGAASRLPPGVRNRLRRLLRLGRPDMGDIEREYAKWIAQYDCIDDSIRRSIGADIARMPDPPLISVLMPVFNPPPTHLSEAIRSVQDQLYPRWELCIADDASTDAAVVELLRTVSERDHRIKLVRRDRNGHISAASNSALRLATGPFVALLDHDDLLPVHALYQVATTILAHPDVDIVYSDEDHIDDEGHRSHPYFKPDWNPDLMLGQNLISHFGVYRRKLVERIGGFRIGFEGSQDYDLALRMVAETRRERIRHIPKVLYHWRQGAGDPTFSEASHQRCVDNGRRAVQQFLGRDHPKARAEATTFVAGWTRVVYPVPDPAPLVSVVLSATVSGGIVASCIEHLLTRTDYPALEILTAADDTGASPEVAASDHRVRRIVGRSPHWTNQVAEAARGSLLLLLDPGLVPSDAGWLQEMVSQAVRPAIGAVGAKLLSTRGTVRHAGLVLGGRNLAFTPFLGRRRAQDGYFGHLQIAREVTAVSGQCLMVRRAAFLAVGGLDEVLAQSAFSDVDLCLKLAGSGWRTVWTPYAELCVGAEAPRQRTGFEQAVARMRQRWGDRLDADCFWSPNLSFNPSDIGLAFPPSSAVGCVAPAGAIR
ncbi:glycosyltransferase [Rhodopila sp.]|uniref:glycosyltransferase n=1 Tax=Rhodopila sp. TaxID=2480087 RepID=UPI003D0A20AC